MAVIDTSKTAQEYATALHHLLPPGRYFSGENTENMTLAMGEELARVHAQVDVDFDFETHSEEVLGWTLENYRTLLTDAGFINFTVSDKYSLPFFAGGNRSGDRVGAIENVFVIKITYENAQQALFESFAPTLEEHKLVHSVILGVNIDTGAQTVIL